MKVTKVEIWDQPLTLREPLVYAHHTVSSVINIGCRVHFNDGIYGLGFAAPETEVTGETTDSVRSITNDVFIPMMIGEPARSIADRLGEIQLAGANQPAARAMIDMALHDYLSKKQGVPLYKMLGASRTSIPTAVTIYIHSVEETKRRATKLLNEGYKILKVKGGIDIELDIARINALGEAFSHVPLIWDVNQGYSPDELRKFCQECNHPQLLAIEQPLKKDDGKLICKISKEISLPIMVDESLCTRSDAKFFADGGIRFFNIKLMKSGSIRSCIEIAQTGDMKGVKSIYSCMDECAYVNSAGLHAALASRGVSFVDLDSFTDYRFDPTRNSIRLINGELTPTQAIGIGIYAAD